MSINNPEIRAKVIDWQRRHNIHDDDPAMALLELLDFYYRPAEPGPAEVSTESVSQAVRTAMTPLLERLSTQIQSGTHSSLSPEVIQSTIKSALAPSIDRLTALIQEERNPVDVQVSADAISEAIRLALMPAIERVTFQTQELKNRMETIDLEKFSAQIAAYHDGIDYCTKKLDVVKKESDSLLVRIDRASASIKPVTKGAVAFLMGISGVVGYILAVILR